ncbi:MAG: response regulator [Candidatus Scalindua sp. AMX11]|nr:MAG: response regulator [Candidatus Scalindua sp.]NOG83070.1 response regulator [Planctomycetota bacterium]RZV79534.1 MAG: response regulator [Candidatus Scalindua sp. SCAELEC01]TDE65170.1 MAG: response regulator [Candidatus Scalindua sp. AMX11]GJQ58594.1 MAG: two-component system response regulator [Candidatus Scalindua sp.]
MAVVLAVESNKNQRLLYEHELSAEGYEVITAASGKEALNKVRGLHPDIIVMDISKPKTDVLEAIGVIIGRSKHTPIIIHTAYSRHKESFMSWAADAYLFKSSDLTKLKKIISDLLKEKSVTASA